MRTPEALARVKIDAALEAAGWCVQDAHAVNLHAGHGVAVREFPLPGFGEADYLLFAGGQAVGAVEAKKEGATLTGVETQSAKYGAGLPAHIPAPVRPLPFLYESTGVETRFTDRLDPDPRSRRIFAFHRPETALAWLAPSSTAVTQSGNGIADERAAYDARCTLRGRLQHLPPINETGLWPAQIQAVRGLERSLQENRPRALIQMATTHAQQVVSKLWNYCNVLRDDGLSYGDYVEQLTYLLFLKMADERTRPPYNQPSAIPPGHDWPSLVSRDGDALEVHYRHTLETLGRCPGMLGVIFRKAQNKIQDPAKLRRLVADLIDRERWTTLDADVKGDAYEGLLEKNAQDTKGGAGQYFTPRPLIQAIVDVIQPAPGETICDPACGTGGFLLAAHDYVATHHALDRDEKKHLRLDALRGVELVDGVTRLCAMNLLLHGIGPVSDEADPPVKTDDSLRADPGARFDVVLSNPPFGRKSSVMTVTAEGEQEREALTVVRDDFWASTSNKQLNFVQHIKTNLAIPGRAAVVVPDNVLFEGGAGETVRRKLLHECDVHTLLRLPTGIFYGQGVKANVLFFDKKPASPTPGPKPSGSTTSAPTSVSPSRPTPSIAPTWTSSSPVTAWRTATLASPPGPRTIQPAAGAPTPWTNCSPATRPASTSSGSKTTPWRTPSPSPTPTSSPPRSSKTSAPHSSNSR